MNEEQRHQVIVEEMKKYLKDTINEVLPNVIKEVVNGKIDKQSESLRALQQSNHEAGQAQLLMFREISKKLDDYIKEDEQWKDHRDVIEADWKTRAEPVIKMGENAQGASKLILYLSSIIIAVGGAWAIIKTLIHK